MKEIPTVQQPSQAPQQPIYQQQPPMHQPTYQPPQQPPRSRKRLWLIIGIVTAILLVIGIIGGIAGQGQPTSNTSATQATQQVTTQPTQPPTTQPTQSNTIGKPVQVGDTWVVTVNSVKTNAGSEFSQPKNGNTYVVVDITLKNISSSNQTVSSLMMFSMKDQTGQGYTQTITDFAKQSPDGAVSSGSMLRGEIVYEVPSSVNTFTLSFVPGFSASDMAEWNVKV